MAPQHVEVAETIINLKRALRREKESASDQPISSATNRYNKLKKGANYVHAGALPYPHGPHGYKQPIEHAGYKRYILDRNPRRYNELGDELEEEEDDREADADAREENPYSNVRIEELLCPLKHPSELATHPTLSVPYLDSALTDMVRTTDEKLRQERVNLWRAKNLHRQLVGDEPWMPLERIETPDDWDLFEPKPKTVEDSSKKRKREDTEMQLDAVNGSDDAVNGTVKTTAKDTKSPNGEKDSQQHRMSEKEHTATEDVTMQDTTTITDAAKPTIPNESQNIMQTNGNTDPGDGTKATEDDIIDPVERNGDNSDNSNTPPPPPRRITRALAAGNDASPVDSPSPTISSITSTLLTPDPIFLLPPTLNSSTRFPNLSNNLSLPPDELLETRRLLYMYIQKQEESVRGHEALLSKLIKAKRMRQNVWDWCKAEGHVGEWSDGEDWIDAEAWGEKEEDLRKGKDEEEVAEEERLEAERAGGGRGGKGKRRRGAARE